MKKDGGFLSGDPDLPWLLWTVKNRSELCSCLQASPIQLEFFVPSFSFQIFETICIFIRL